MGQWTNSEINTIVFVLLKREFKAKANHSRERDTVSNASGEKSASRLVGVNIANFKCRYDYKI
jgi:hypothetical protein